MAKPNPRELHKNLKHKIVSVKIFEHSDYFSPVTLHATRDQDVQTSFRTYTETSNFCGNESFNLATRNRAHLSVYSLFS
jgi:hypothetical protein